MWNAEVRPVAKDQPRSRSRALQDLMERISEMQKHVQVYVKMAPAVLKQAQVAARELRKEYTSIQSGIRGGKRKRKRRK
jgi:hypothetical protein